MPVTPPVATSQSECIFEQRVSLGALANFIRLARMIQRVINKLTSSAVSIAANVPITPLTATRGGARDQRHAADELPIRPRAAETARYRIGKRDALVSVCCTHYANVSHIDYLTYHKPDGLFAILTISRLPRDVP